MSHLVPFADPAVLDLIWTCFAAVVLLAAGGTALAILPWSDAQIASVDDEFRALVCPPARRATLTR